MRGELSKDNSSSSGRSMSGKAASLPLPGWERGKGEEALVKAWPGWLPTVLAGARFLLATDSSARAVQPSV